MVGKKKSKEAFVEKANKRHNNRFDYSNSVYLGSDEPIMIECKVDGHPSFTLKRASKHITKDYPEICPLCAMQDKLDIAWERFLTNAIACHGDKYIYSKEGFQRAKKPITITCRTHGKFLIPRAMKHYDKYFPQGCCECALENRKVLLEEFLERAKAAHGDKYDYSKVNFKDMSTPVTIGCRVEGHEDFNPSPKAHTKKNQPTGCPECGIIQRSLSQRITQEEFLERAKELHGDKYDYSKTAVVLSSKEVTIGCPVHGDFPQIVSSHLMGYGCKKCADEETARNNTKSVEQFISEAREVHGDMYGYDNVVYINTLKPVNITCFEHNADFPQTPDAHLAGKGCHICCIRGFDRQKESYLYCLISDNSSYMKIGITNKCNFDKRMLAINKNTPFNFQVVSTALFNIGYDAYNLEQETLKQGVAINLLQNDGTISREWLEINYNIIKGMKNKAEKMKSFVCLDEQLSIV